ncbi:uncharacterized protein Haspin [Anoplolepis gracilipes]|uniref:uncharacterized protein Haspin n=1 Tax=Anoplolepis gracilipes TaxID=354296 RepID=UPI003B9EFB71
MMLSRKRPLRTYEKKSVKKPLINSLPSPVILIRKYNPAESVDCLDDSKICNESLHDDPFETTFDRIAKGAVVPPIPWDTNQNSSWKDSSSGSDINSTNAAKSNENTAFELLTYNGLDKFDSSRSYTLKSTYKSVKITRKCKRNKSKVSKEIVSKKITVMPKDKTKEQRRQGNKKQRKKVQSKYKKSSRTCNEQTSHINSADINNLEHSHKRDISYNRNNTLNFQQIIKPCFVELDACIVQNYIMNHEKAVKAKEDVLHDVKLLSDITNTSHTKKDISKERNVILQPIQYDNIIGRFKHLSIKECFVALHNDIVKNCVSKTEKDSIGAVDINNESNIPHFTLHNLSASYNTNCTEFVSHIAKRNYGKLIKDSIVKMEKLKVEEFVKKDDMIFRERKQHIISSTPVSKHVKSYACSAFFSPININDAHPRHESSIPNVETDASNIMVPDQKNSPSVIMPLNYYIKIGDIQKHPTQSLLFSQKAQTKDFAVKTEDSSSFEDIHTLPTQKLNVDSDVAMEAPPHSLNVLSVADTGSSLFSNTTHNYSSKNKTEEYKVPKIHSTNMSTCDEIAPATDSFVDMFLEQKQVNDNTNTNTDETSNTNKGSFLSESQDVNNTALLARLQDSIRITGKRAQYPKWDFSIHQSSNISKNSSNKVSSSFEDIHTLPTQKCKVDNDVVMEVPPYSLNTLSVESNSKISKHDAVDEKICDIQSKMYNLECSINTVKNSFELLVGSAQSHHVSDANKQIEKSVFLKPGKFWARSLSILNHINDGSNLDKLSLGKGKRWRHSVKDILEMQKQGIFQSCLKKDKDDADLSCTEFDTSDIVSSFNKCKTVDSSNHARLSKRISVRVVPNNTRSIGCKIKDTSFLEVFGIKSEKSPSLELSHRKESHDNRIIKGHFTTARDVVLQRCSQSYYLSFSYCFPDSYLEYCRKIGEGVYGEVFLYEYLDKKSVIKIIPIEGGKLVNGEAQKKFNEILSEIVIAKELDNLRLNTTYKTSGFVEVRSVKCIMGKYPEKLVELWKTYDDNRSSDNDCPSMFDENQLYIALELGDGGDDLEAFVFQTAEEACALFLQIAFALAVAEKALEFEHRDLHWGNVLISRTKETYVSYNLDGKEIRVPSKGVKVSIIDFTLSRMLYQGCCIYNDLALDPALFTAHGEYQFEIYRLMREKIQNNWNKFEPYTNILWLHYTLDKMITAVRYKRKNLKVHKQAIIRLKEFKDIILNYDSAFDFVTDSSVAHL